MLVSGRNEWRRLCSLPNNSWCCRLPALDAALEFQEKTAVPSAWKTEVKEDSSSSEEDDEEEAEEQEEDANNEEEEVGTKRFRSSSTCMVKVTECCSCLQEEVEPFPEERENFLQQLYKFMEDRGESGEDVLCSSLVTCSEPCLLCRNSHQQAARPRLQKPQPLQALPAGPQTGGLRQCERCFCSPGFVTFFTVADGPCLSVPPRSRAAPFGSRSTRTWESLYSTRLQATTSNVLIASTFFKIQPLSGFSWVFKP